jgi:hypothetical protein
MSIIQKIRQKVQRGEVFFSEHAYDELKADYFSTLDAIRAIMNGKVIEKLTYDHRGTRYVILGTATDNREIEIVCRFHESGNLIIITGYE